MARMAGRAPAIGGSAEGGSSSSTWSTYFQPSAKTSTSSAAERDEADRRARRRASRRRARRATRAAGSSERRRRRAPRSFVHLAELAHEPDRDEVHDEASARTASRPTAKIVLYSIEPVGDVALPGRGDERGHRLHRLGRVEGQVRLPAGGDQHDHRLAHRARDREHERGDDPRDRGRHDDAQRRPGARFEPSA